MNVALSFIDGQITSLQQPRLQTIIATAAKKHITLMSIFHNKKQQYNKMRSDTEYLPNSVRNKFELQASDDLKKDPGFKPCQEKSV